MAKAKKTARIICANDNEFWTTQKQFWKWVREGLVDVTGQRPLTGRFAGKREKLLVMIRHVILDNASLITSRMSSTVMPDSSRTSQSGAMGAKNVSADARLRVWR